MEKWVDTSERIKKERNVWGGEEWKEEQESEV
jgi:hypothetical protein